MWWRRKIWRGGEGRRVWREGWRKERRGWREGVMCEPGWRRWEWCIKIWFA